MAFKYDVISLIELVESKPCLWNKFNENNRNKILREKSRQEIFSFLDDEYDQLSSAEKKTRGRYSSQQFYCYINIHKYHTIN